LQSKVKIYFGHGPDYTLQCLGKQNPPCTGAAPPLKPPSALSRLASALTFGTNPAPIAMDAFLSVPKNWIVPGAHATFARARPPAASTPGDLLACSLSHLLSSRNLVFTFLMIRRSAAVLRGGTACGMQARPVIIIAQNKAVCLPKFPPRTSSFICLLRNDFQGKVEIIQSPWSTSSSHEKRELVIFA
jgi:hypothetical protein